MGKTYVTMAVFAGIVRAAMQIAHADEVPLKKVQDYLAHEELTEFFLDRAVQVDGVDYPAGVYGLSEEAAGLKAPAKVEGGRRGAALKAKAPVAEQPKTSGLNKALASAAKTRSKK